MTTAIDKGKLIWAKLAGECAECGGTIFPGQPIYFSRQLGSRHRTCVDRDAPAAQPPAAPRAARDEPPRAPRGEPGRLPFGDEAPRAARDETPRAERDAPLFEDVYRAPARDTAFGRAGDRDVARREVGDVLDLVIASHQKFVEALQRIRKLLE